MTTFQEGRGKDSNSSSKVGTSPPALELGARPSGTSLPLATFGPHVRHTRHVPKRRSSLERGSRRVSSKASRKKGEWRCGSHLFSLFSKMGDLFRRKAKDATASKDERAHKTIGAMERGALEHMNKTGHLPGGAAQSPLRAHSPGGLPSVPSALRHSDIAAGTTPGQPSALPTATPKPEWVLKNPGKPGAFLRVLWKRDKATRANFAWWDSFDGVHGGKMLRVGVLESDRRAINEFDLFPRGASCHNTARVRACVKSCSKLCTCKNCMRMHAHILSHTQIRARARARTHTHTHTLLLCRGTSAAASERGHIKRADLRISLCHLFFPERRRAGSPGDGLRGPARGAVSSRRCLGQTCHRETSGAQADRGAEACRLADL